jgi:hypothetical protein
MIQQEGSMSKVKISKLYALRELEDLTGRTVAAWRKDIREGRVDTIRLGRLVRVPEPEVARLYSQGLVSRTR